MNFVRWASSYEDKKMLSYSQGIGSLFVFREMSKTSVIQLSHVSYYERTSKHEGVPMPIYSTESPKEIWWTEHFSWPGKKVKLLVDHTLCQSWQFLLLMNLLSERQD